MINFMIIKSLRYSNKLRIAIRNSILKELLTLNSLVLSLCLNFVLGFFQLCLAYDHEFGEVFLNPLANQFTSVNFQLHLFFLISLAFITEVGIYFVFNQVDIKVDETAWRQFLLLIILSFMKLVQDFFHSMRFSMMMVMVLFLFFLYIGWFFLLFKV